VTRQAELLSMGAKPRSVSVFNGRMAAINSGYRCGKSNLPMFAIQQSQLAQTETCRVEEGEKPRAEYSIRK